MILGNFVTRLVGARCVSRSAILFKDKHDPPVNTVDMVDIEDKSAPIPHYEQKIGEPLKLKKAR